MSNSDKDQRSVMGSNPILKFAPCPLRLIAKNDVASSPIRRIGPNSGPDGNGRPRKKRERENYGSEKENFVSSAVDPSLTVKIPAETDRDRDENESDGFRTPTSADQKIPAATTCPPPPKKAVMVNRREASRPRRVLLDLSNNEIESLFPPAIRKRIRQ